MQIQIRNPVAVEIKTADTEEAFSLRFITATGHEAAVELTSELISDLLEELKALAPKPAPVRSNLRELLRI
jgi:hypothetical protein